ncbi:MAG TPA: cysteine methyltransferase, partial [Muricauda sp.]|nr:cysteine methyltransferase [Allomuricauda sp.]
MQTAYIQTPIGTAELKGDEKGLASITVLDDKKLNGIIPEVLKDAVSQFEEYFNGD